MGERIDAAAPSSTVSVVRVHAQLYRLMLGRYQAYLWRDEGSATLIDTGEVGAWPMIADALGQIGLRPSDLERVVLTHFHDDHAGSAAEVRDRSSAAVAAHAADAAIIRGEKEGPAPNFTDFERALHAQVADGLMPAPPVAVDHELDDGDLLDFGGGARVLATPGHTDGSIALHLPRHRLLLTGDIAAENEGEVMLGVFNLDRSQAVSSFQRLAELDVDVACFGHGEPVVEHASTRLRQAAAGLTAE